MIFKGKNLKAGMTFIELVVVIGIFAVMTGIVFFNFSGFTTTISLQNLASQIALQVKKAQTSSLSGTNPILFGTNKPSYGIHFDDSSPASGKKFDYFADYYPQNGLDDSAVSCVPGPANECLSQIIIQTGDAINNLCVNNGGDCTQRNLDLLFKRPFPDAIFHYGNYVGIISNAEVELRSLKGFYKTIIVGSTGQIEVRDGCVAKIFSNSTCP
jgi:prepilin-type N-terminal cleavage/methylation domain-containing protein